MTSVTPEGVDAKAREILGSVVGQPIDGRLFAHLQAEFEKNGFKGVSVRSDATTGDVEVSGQTLLDDDFTACLSRLSV